MTKVSLTGNKLNGTGFDIKSIIRSLLPTNSFVRGVSVLVGGTLGAQAITVLSSPIITRLYSPEDFGLMAVYVSLLSIITVIASLRYQLAIPLPEDEKDAAAIVVLSLLVVLVISLLCIVIVWIFGDIIAHSLNVPLLANYLWLLPVGTCLAGTYQVFNLWSVRTKAFRLIAHTKLTQSVSALIVQVAGHGFGPIALILGQVMSQAAGGGSLIRDAFRHHSTLFKEVLFADVVAQASRYLRFPIYSTWSGLFNTVGSQLPSILFATLFSPAAAGIYALTYRVLSMPMALVGQAIGQVFFSRASEANRNGQLTGLVTEIHAKLAHIAMPPMLILIIAGPELFSWGFGAEWRQAGIFSRWMAPWLYMVFVTSPLSSLFSVMENQVHDMFFQSFLLTTRVVSILIGAWMGELIWAVALFSVCSAICWIGFLVWIVRASGNPWSALWVPTVKSFALASLLVSPIFITSVLSGNIWLWLASLVVSGGLVALRYGILFKAAWR